MAIPHFRGDFVGAGKSPLSSAAYNHRTPMTDLSIKTRFSSKSDHDLVHAEIAIPLNSPPWIVRLAEAGSVPEQSAALWNSVIANERNELAQTARKFIVALPRELTIAQNIELVREYVASELTARGFVVDWVLHVDPDKAGNPNPHVHIMHTLRPLTEEGFGPKRIALRDDDGGIRRNAQNKIVYRQFMGDRGTLIDLRTAWASTVTRYLAAAGHDFVLDLRSYADQRVKLTPTTHIGPNGNERRAKNLDSTAVDAHAAARELSAEDIERDPGCIVRLVSRQQSVFDRRDIARTLHTFIDDSPQFTRALDRALAHPELVNLAKAEIAPDGKDIVPAKFTTRTMFALEARMSERAQGLAARQSHAVSREAVTAALDRSAVRLSSEQAAAVEHITRGTDLASIVGYAGTGKSTLLQVAASAWADAGHEVVGGALASKAARGLQAASGIPSETVAKWIWNWNQGGMRLSANSVFVLDEAGMVGSADMAAIIAEVTRAGAKLVLVGDPEQLQPIAAGGAFRVLAERCGAVELADVRRQLAPWAREATIGFQRGHVEAAVKAYAANGAFAFVPDRIAAVTAIADAVMASREQLNTSKQPATQIVLAHRNDDILALNTVIHERRAEAGLLGPDVAVETTKGARMMATGDRVLFLKNAVLDTVPGQKTPVSNSDFGTVLSIKDGAPVKDGGNGPVLTVAIDGGRTVSFSTKSYPDFDLGYATTVHKAQGATVDRVLVLASDSMSKSLAYVAMSRQREDVKVVVPQSEIADLKALALVFSRTSPKLTTLDYAEMRGVGPKPVIPLELSPLVQAGRAVVEAARQAFEAVKAKFEAVAAAVQARLAPAAEVAKQVTAVPPVEVQSVVEAKPTGTAPGPVVERAEVPVVTSSQANKPVAAVAVTDMAKPVPPKRESSMFAGLKLNAGAAAPKTAPAPKVAPPTPLALAVERWAAADRAIAHVVAMRLPPVAAQANALADAKSALEALRPDAVAALQSALKHEPAARSALTDSIGHQRGAELVRCLDREQAAAQDPSIRAARLVASWHAAVTGQMAAREAGGGSKHIEAAKVDLRDAARAIASDPQAVAVMRGQAAELGIREGSTLAVALKTPDVGKALMTVIDPPALGWSR
jgi:Ti-type conjugative transfer relaxase TraA